ncbi:MAG: GldG family protein [Gammaproteobacteria bacterium]|nr:GldG family protein [Gammaproteobacteria bacterium]
MEINRKTRLQFRIQNLVFLVLFLAVIGLLAWLSQRYNFDSDWTATGRHTLSNTSITLLSRIEGPVQITAFAHKEVQPAIKEFINRYQKHKPDIKLNFVNPDIEPDKVRAMGITVEGELVISYLGRSEHVTNFREESITNSLQRLLRSQEKNLVFLSGHGERQPNGQANHDYNLFSKYLASKGIKIVSLNLTEQPAIPDDTAILIIAGPQIDYFDGEVELIRNYLKQGGNLLWLHDPGALYNLDKLAQDLHIRFIDGVIVDPTTQLLGISDPSFALVARYNEHPITRDFALMTLFPRASGIQFIGQEEWTATHFLQSIDRSWAESGIMQGVIEYTADQDIAGPLAMGMALTRDSPTPKATNEKQASPQQRVVVLGDGDFLSNAYLGNQGNQDLGYNIINWLSHDDNFIAIPSRKAPDTELVMSEIAWSLLGLFFLLGLPLLLLGSGVFIWMKRRKQ